MPLRTEKAGSRAVPRTHRGESRQGIPGRVALQQSPLALPLPGSLCHRSPRSPRKFQRTATVEIPRVSRKGSPHPKQPKLVHRISSHSSPFSPPGTLRPTPKNEHQKIHQEPSPIFGHLRAPHQPTPPASHRTPGLRRIRRGVFYAPGEIQATQKTARAAAGSALGRSQFGDRGRDREAAGSESHHRGGDRRPPSSAGLGRLARAERSLRRADQAASVYGRADRARGAERLGPRTRVWGNVAVHNGGKLLIGDRVLAARIERTPR